MKTFRQDYLFFNFINRTVSALWLSLAHFTVIASWISAHRWNFTVSFRHIPSNPYHIDQMWTETRPSLPALDPAILACISTIFRFREHTFPSIERPAPSDCKYACLTRRMMLPSDFHTFQILLVPLYYRFAYYIIYASFDGIQNAIVFLLCGANHEWLYFRFWADFHLTTGISIDFSSHNVMRVCVCALITDNAYNRPILTKHPMMSLQRR